MKIICIGRNYAKHAKEMKNELPSEPVFFLKPETSVLKDSVFFYPDFSKNIHYECEIIVKISRMGKHIKEKFAHKYYDQIGLGIDFTARDIQKEAKEAGLPWEKAKAFDQSAAISSQFINKTELNLADLRFQLDLNGKTVQSGSSADMIFNIDHLISYVSSFITLKTGDLLFSGTPEGIGAVKAGDQLIGRIGDKIMFEIKIK